MTNSNKKIEKSTRVFDNYENIKKYVYIVNDIKSKAINGIISIDEANTLNDLAYNKYMSNHK